jgi:hypothetical protein
MARPVARHYPGSVVISLVLALALVAPPPAPRPVAELGEHAGEGGVMQQLVRRSDGGYEHANRRAGFRATIHADGTVTFRDFAVTHGNVKVMGIDLTTGEAQVPDGSTPSNTLVRPQTLGDLGDDLLVKNGPYGPPPIIASAGGRVAGIADLAAATRRAAEKQRFLDATEPLRTKMAEEHRRANERTALVNLDAELRAIWRAADTPVSMKKERLFQRWDECVQAPDDPATANADTLARARAGEIARRRIEAWIRRNVPRSHADAFTKAELHEMNARRRSKGRFDPYAGRAIAPAVAGPVAPPPKP